MTLRGSTSEFPLESVIGLLAGTSKTGELQVRAGAKIGALGFAGGRLVAAVMDGEGGENALGAIFAITEAEFEFTSWASAPEANLESGDLVSLLKRAAEARDRIGAIREAIPDDRARFRLSEKAADSGAVTFTPDRWRALLAVNGERDVAAIAEQLRIGKMQTLSLLAGLVKDGVIETIAAPAAAAPAAAAPSSAPQYAPTPEPEPPPPTPEPEPAAQVEIEPGPPLTKGWPPAPEPSWDQPRDTAPEPAVDWSSPPPIARPSEGPSAPQTEVRADLNAEIAERFSGFETRPPEPPPPSATSVPPAVDDRLASLSGLFAPGPAANASAPPSTESAPPATGQPSSPPLPPTRSAESWMPPPPAAVESPANEWAPTKPPPAEAVPGADPWARTATPAAPDSPAASATAPAQPRADEWAPPPPAPPVPEVPTEKKKGGFFGRFRRDEPPAPVERINPALVASKSGLLASLSNAMLMEYNSGSYGKGKIETRMANLLMRVDEQADPIDRPLPVVDDLIDAAALEREGFAEDQAVPYLATLVRQIYEDAERAYGKDKAKKGYKAAQQHVFGTENALQSTDFAGKLPKV